MKPFADEPPEKEEKLRQDHADTCARVDAYRAVWGLNAWQLFGVRKCMTLWDELRRLTEPPAHAFLYELWVLARGTDRRGRLAAECGIQGDAQGFIEKLGGLAACRERLVGVAKRQPRLDVARLTVAKTNYYGDTTSKQVGIMLVRREYKHCVIGMRPNKKGILRPHRGWRVHKTQVESLVTRTEVWKMEPMTDEHATAAGLSVREKAKWEPIRAADLASLDEGLPPPPPPSPYLLAFAFT